MCVELFLKITAPTTNLNENGHQLTNYWETSPIKLLGLHVQVPLSKVYAYDIDSYIIINSHQLQIHYCTLHITVKLKCFKSNC